MESLIIAHAWKDPVFKKEFLANPKATIEKYSGQKLPDNVKIVANEENANTMYFTIPQAPANMNELSDEDLEKVAGGTDIVAAIITAVSAIVGAGISVANDQTRSRAGW